MASGAVASARFRAADFRGTVAGHPAGRRPVPAVGYERRANILLGLVHAACELICLKSLN